MPTKNSPKRLLRGASVPVIAAMTASIFLTATPGLLYGAAINGAIVTKVGSSVEYELSATQANNGDITLTLAGLGTWTDKPNQSPLKDDPAALAALNKCFSVPGSNNNQPTGGELTTEDYAAIVAFFCAQTQSP